MAVQLNPNRPTTPRSPCSLVGILRSLCGISRTVIIKTAETALGIPNLIKNLINRPQQGSVFTRDMIITYSSATQTTKIASPEHISNTICSTDPRYSRIIDRTDPSSYVLWDLNEAVKGLKALVPTINIDNTNDRHTFEMEMLNAYNLVNQSIDKFLSNNPTQSESFQPSLQQFLGDPIAYYNNIKSEIEESAQVVLIDDGKKRSYSRSLGDDQWGIGSYFH